MVHRFLCSSSGVLLQDVIVLLNLMLEVEAMMYHVFVHIAFVGMLVSSLFFLIHPLETSHKA